MKVYSFKLNEEIPEELEIIKMLESWKEKDGTVKSFVLNRILAESESSLAESKYVNRQEWDHEKAVLRSLYSLMDSLFVDIEKLKEEVDSLKPKPYKLVDVPIELQ